jgi:gas vesicle protein
MTVEEKLKYLGVALVAGTVGAMVALLIAPQSGRDTRKLLRKRYDRESAALRKKSRRMIEDAEEFVEGKIQDGRRVIDHAGERVVDSLETGKKKVSRLVGV